MSETEYVSSALGNIIKWARKYQVHVLLLAHTTKIGKDKDGKYMIPTLYSISGSANFFNKPHNGICIYRDYQKNITDVYVQKVKQSWYGQIGFSSYRFDVLTRQYEFLSCSVDEKPKDSTAIPLFAEGNGSWKPLKMNMPDVDFTKDQPF